MKTEQAIA